jgi:hypothetical protein
MFCGRLIRIGVDSSPPFKSQRWFCEDLGFLNLYSTTTRAFKITQVCLMKSLKFSYQLFFLGPMADPKFAGHYQHQYHFPLQPKFKWDPIVAMWKKWQISGHYDLSFCNKIHFGGIPEAPALRHILLVRKPIFLGVSSISYWTTIFAIKDQDCIRRTN